MLSPEASAEPGRWTTSRAEYQRGIMDAVSDPETETVVVMKAAQIGWTEILNNVVGYHIAQDPAPILVVQPTVEMGMAWSKDRLSPMLRDTPQLRGLVAAPRSRDGDNTLLHKTFPGGHLTIAGANSPASLAQRSVRIVAFDDVDRYPASAGTEGDPIALGSKRAATFWNRKILIGSTPTVAGASRIEFAYQQSDQRRFFVPCPHCGHEQTLRFQQVRWRNNNPSTALYHCENCDTGWTDAERWAAGRSGVWKPSQPFTGTAGFHISELYSPWRTLAQIVSDFLEARPRPDMLKAWVNTALGETWQESGEAPDWQRLYDRREEWPPQTVPRGALALTAGVDVQRDRLEASVWGWGRDRRSWLIDHIVIPGSPFLWPTWQALGNALETSYSHENGGLLHIQLTAVDSSDGVSTAEVYAFVRKFGAGRAIAVKGREQLQQAIQLGGKTEVRRSGRRIGNMKLWLVGTSFLKGELYGHLRLERPTEESGEDFPPGYVHLPRHVAGEEFCRQLTAEELRYVKMRNGFARREWVKTRERNEALDCRIYARAAAVLLGVDRWREKDWAKREAEVGSSSISARPPASLGGPLAGGHGDEDEALQPAAPSQATIQGPVRSRFWKTRAVSPWRSAMF